MSMRTRWSHLNQAGISSSSGSGSDAASGTRPRDWFESRQGELQNGTFSGIRVRINFGPAGGLATSAGKEKLKKMERGRLLLTITTLEFPADVNSRCQQRSAATLANLRRQYSNVASSQNMHAGLILGSHPLQIRWLL